MPDASRYGKKKARTKSRKSDNVALPAVPQSESKTVSIRKIDNGWLIDESSYTDNSYKCRTVYSKTKPQLDFD